MKPLIAILVVVLLMALTAVVVLWVTPPPAAPVRSVGESPNGWQRIAGAVAVGGGAYAGREQGARAMTDLARGAGWL